MMLSQLLSDAVVFGFIYTTSSKPASRNGFLRTKLQCLYSYGVHVTHQILLA